MDEARAVINIKEGTIEIQGPVDFVRHYFDLYQPIIRKMSVLAGQAQALEKAPRGRRAAAERVKSVPCPKAIRSELEAGFFDGPRSVGEIKQRLGEAGYDFTDSNVRNCLKRLTASGVLNAIGSGRGLRYQKMGQT
jgi:hypothetical protein